MISLHVADCQKVRICQKMQFFRDFVPKSFPAILALYLLFSGLTCAIQVFDLSEHLARIQPGYLSQSSCQRLFIWQTGTFILAVPVFIVFFKTNTKGLNPTQWHPFRQAGVFVACIGMLVLSSIPFFLLSQTVLGSWSLVFIAAEAARWMLYSCFLFTLALVACLSVSSALRSAHRTVVVTTAILLLSFWSSRMNRLQAVFPWETCRRVLNGETGGRIVIGVEILLTCILFAVYLNCTQRCLQNEKK